MSIEYQSFLKAAQGLVNIVQAPGVEGLEEQGEADIVQAPGVEGLEEQGEASYKE